MTTKESAIDTNFMTKILNVKLNWRLNVFDGLLDKSIEDIYNKVINEGNIIKKTKPYPEGSKFFIRLPVDIARSCEWTYGDRITIKVTGKKEIIFRKDKNGLHKLGKNNMVSLPMALIDKNYLKLNYDTMVMWDGIKITVKSFAFM